MVAAGDEEVLAGRILHEDIHVVHPELMTPRSADIVAIIGIIGFATIEVGATGGSSGEGAGRGQLVTDTIGGVGPEFGLLGEEHIDGLVVLASGFSNTIGVVVVDVATIHGEGNVVVTVVEGSKVDAGLIGIVHIDISYGAHLGTVELLGSELRRSYDFDTAENPRLLIIVEGDDGAGGVAHVDAVTVLVEVTIGSDVITIIGVAIGVGITGRNDAVIVTPAVTGNVLLFLGGVAHNAIGDGVPTEGEVVVSSGGNSNAVAAESLGGKAVVTKVITIDRIHIVATGVGTRHIIEIVEIVLQRVGIEETLLVDVIRSCEGRIASGEVGHFNAHDGSYGAVLGDVAGS